MDLLATITTPIAPLITLTIATCSVSTGLAAIFLVARLYSRFRLERSIGNDDCRWQYSGPIAAHELHADEYRCLYPGNGIISYCRLCFPISANRRLFQIVSIIYVATFIHGMYIEPSLAISIYLGR